MKISVRFWALLASAVYLLSRNGTGFKVMKKYSVPGDGGFDYIVFDSSANRLYVSHGTEVTVLDANFGKVLGKVDDTPGVHGSCNRPGFAPRFYHQRREWDGLGF